jgi:nicotinate phosphoribosyltransferase
MKLSKDKVTYPGRKQVFRVKGSAGLFMQDILGLEKERIKGIPLLIKVVNRGKILHITPPLEEIRKTVRENLAGFKKPLQDIDTKYTYPVRESVSLRKLRVSLAHQLETRQ